MSRIVTKMIQVAIHATADDWQLYNRPGRNDAANALNQRFEELVNGGASRREIRDGMNLSEYSDLGAADSEGFHFVEFLLEKTFGEEYWK